VNETRDSSWRWRQWMVMVGMRAARCELCILRVVYVSVGYGLHVSELECEPTTLEVRSSHEQRWPGWSVWCFCNLGGSFVDVLSCLIPNGHGNEAEARVRRERISARADFAQMLHASTIEIQQHDEYGEHGHWHHRDLASSSLPYSVNRQSHKYIILYDPKNYSISASPALRRSC
jgi:hypothetical protein